MPRTNFTLIQRLLARVSIDPETACWLWTAAKDHDGYGGFMVRCDGSWKHFRAHRLSYELFKGPIPEGMTIDHLCHDPALCTAGNSCPHRRCINPDHLEAASMKVNVLRGGSPSAKHAKATHCKRGHPLEGDNLYILPKGRGRQCLACRRLKKANWEKAHREMVNAAKRRRYYKDVEKARATEREYKLRRKAQGMQVLTANEKAS